MADAHDDDLRLVVVPVEHSSHLPSVDTPRHHAWHFFEPALHGRRSSSGPRHGLLSSYIRVRIALSVLTAAAAPPCYSNDSNEVVIFL